MRGSYFGLDVRQSQEARPLAGELGQSSKKPHATVGGLDADSVGPLYPYYVLGIGQRYVPTNALTQQSAGLGEYDTYGDAEAVCKRLKVEYDLHG